MSAITLVLPFALPPSELAPDLIKHLKAPSLAALLSKSSRAAAPPPQEGLHHLPHEHWLARALGLADGTAWASAAMRNGGAGTSEGTWFLVHPAHIEIARSHLLLNDLRQLGLTDAHSRALFDAALPYVRELGLDLHYADAATWLLRADAWAGMQTASPDAAAGLDISFFMPSGPGAAAFRKLQNELQMLWHENDVNNERAARGQASVNAIWTWAGAVPGLPALAAATPLLVDDAPAWLQQVARATGGGIASAGTLPTRDAIVYADLASAPAIASDWGSWIGAVEQIERAWAAPLLAALDAGRIERVRLVLSGRDTLLDVNTTRFALRKFWRRTSLDKLLT